MSGTVGPSIDVDRARVGWWLLAAALGAVLLYLFVSFAGIFVLGLFLYYGLRPLDRRLRERMASPGLASVLTIVVALVPVTALVVYAAWTILPELASFSVVVPPKYQSYLRPFLDVSKIPDEQRELVQFVIRNPGEALDLSRDQLVQIAAGARMLLAAAATVLFHLFAAFGIAFYLLRDDERLAEWFRSTVGDEGSVAYAYATAVDEDLHYIYVGNTLIIFVVGGTAIAVYNGFNAVAPSALSIPAPTLLAALTGLAALVPVIVSKVVYVPVAAYLGVVAARSPEASFAYPIGFLLVSLLVLDLLPQMVVMPKIAGRSVHVGLVLFSYVFGAALFGWYGLFLGALLLVLGVQLVRIVLPELLHGEPLSSDVTSAEAVGSDPPAEGEPDEEPPAETVDGADADGGG